ncbi:copper ABC transporter ATP-binding protein, partial [Rhodanobacter sp. FW510-R12]
LSGRELLDYLARLKQAPRSQVSALLERVGLAHAADRRIGTYSKGMRQRLGLAQTLLGSPELVLLDEPTTGLDPQASRELYRIVGELRADGRSVLLSSHLLAELEPHIDGALILRQGRLLAAGSLHALGEQAALPAQVLVRPREQAMPELIARLETGGLSAQPRPDGQLELQVPRASKLHMLRELLADPAIVDLDVREPTLAQLYDWLGAGPQSSAKVAA